MADDVLKYYGVISIVLIWAGLLFTIYKWPGDVSMSFSKHAAQTKASRLFYFVLFLVTLPMFYAFIVGWYVPTLLLSGWFVLLTTIGVVCQMIAATVPELPGTKATIHNIAAYAMGVTFIPLTGMMLIADVSLLAHAVAVIAMIYMVLSFILYATVKKFRSHYLYFQATYIALFHLVILLSAYT